MDCEGFGMIVGWGVVRVAFEVKLACSRFGGGIITWIIERV